ncbi:potassium efflux system family protein [Myxococcus xanthus DK 1622]|uniref:Potassium efflux system family protein n=1 Tax=Myxococcus xanthus (strain DK1622) TaxID=246197 RepID=Q1DA42_MYXXD|nr:MULTISPECIES: YbaL family putative K(+) efflux transporter [Myxococcus]ABF92808.1 potassium efflux system family protein [Myxococcus xanthus DK 1622]NOJ54637.1 Kef family K(+) transporter [Myxococcus xanthus]QPM81790.1 Kef family K(+) transporter [Myxococcus xanthus]QVW71040.1 Kef family K(+) transporter [Myxococcus xanthus DZ2]QZZ49989.1 Putative cation/proton antiporter YbaL [Myxococcus xanthus]
MPHDTTLIATIAVGLGLAFVGGFVARWLKLPPLVGYLLAGVAVGPFTPGFVADGGLAGQLAEIGVILLMFGVGIHFSIKDLLAVRNIAVPGAVVQIAAATVMGTAVSHWWGWSLGAGLVFGLALSTASTVVLLRALEERGILDSVNGRIAVGWLIVEDLAMVLALVLLPALGNVLGSADTQTPATAAAGDSLIWTLAFTLGKVCLFVALMVVAGTRLVPWLLTQVAKTGSRELFTLSVLAVSLGIAFGAAALFGVSFALGAFFAGVVVSESELSHRVAEDSLPLQDAFSVLFFVSVGMLFDPMVMVKQPLEVLAVLGIIVLGKSLAAFFIVLAFRYPVNTALTVSASLAQIGEFSFILVGLGVTLGLLPKEGQSLVLSGALLSITLNPLVFKTIDPLLAWLRRHPRFAARMDPEEDELSDLPIGMGDVQLREHAVLIGYGRVGGVIGQSLTEQKIPFVVVEQNREYVERLREEGVPAIYGDAAVPGILEHAHLDTASILIVATPDALQARAIVEQAKGVNPSLPAVVRTHGDEERDYLVSLGVDRVVMGEHALARSMLDYVLERLSALKAGPLLPAPADAVVP